MKKIYNNPKIEVVKLQTTQMLAASERTIKIQEDDYGTGSGITLGSREFDYDYDDEEE